MSCVEGRQSEQWEGTSLWKSFLLMGVRSMTKGETVEVSSRLITRGSW